MNLNGALCGPQSTAELDQEGISTGFDFCATKLGEEGSKQPAVCLQQLQRQFLIGLGQGTVACHVGKHDGGQPAGLLDARRVTGGVTPSAVLPLLDDALAWPASRRLAPVATARVTRPQPLLGQAPSPQLAKSERQPGSPTAEFDSEVQE